jgi:hypothetical protein
VLPVNRDAGRIPPAIWALGFVSLLMDVSSELIHSLLPVFMFTALGVSALTIGLIEGAAEATALIVKVFSGVLSDWWGKRKPLAMLGYGLGAISKPLFALAGAPGWWWPPVSSTALARASVARRAMRWWPTSPRPEYAARLSVCASRSIPLVPSSGPCWRWG